MRLGPAGLSFPPGVQLPSNFFLLYFALHHLLDTHRVKRKPLSLVLLLDLLELEYLELPFDPQLVVLVDLPPSVCS